MRQAGRSLDCGHKNPKKTRRLVDADEVFIRACKGRDDKRAVAAIARGANPWRNATMGVRLGNIVAGMLELGMPLAALALAKIAKPEQLIAKDNHGSSALMLSARMGYVEVLRLSAAVEDPLVACHQGGVTALMEAAKGGSLPCVEFLLPLSDLQARDTFGLSALNYAAKGGSVPVAKRLLGLGIPPDDVGCRALILAVERRQVGMVECLMEVFDPLAKTEHWNKSALDVAMQICKDESSVPKESAWILDAVGAKAGLDSAINVLDVYGHILDLPKCRAVLASHVLDIGYATLPGSYAKKSKSL